MNLILSGGASKIPKVLLMNGPQSSVIKQLASAVFDDFLFDLQRKLQDDLDEVNNKWRSVKENFEKFEDDTKERLEDEKRKVRAW